MKKETLRQKEAFEFYYSMGQERSCPKVARKFAISNTSIKKWSKAFRWQKRVEMRDIEIARKLAKKTDIVIVNKKAEMLAIVDDCLDQFKKNLKKKKVDIGTVQDLEKLIRSSMLLMGEKTANIFDAKEIMEFLKGDKPV